MKASYLGGELELFMSARNWKSYWSEKIYPFVTGDVLEVGAGIGSTTLVLSDTQFKSWTCLEPDPILTKQLINKISQNTSMDSYDIICGTLEDLPKGKVFNTILYIDVLEHINNDKEQILSVTDLLADFGHLIILAPAHQWLFSEFDKAIGHFRRYNRKTLTTIVTKEDFKLIYMKYLDSVGLIASLLNRIFLHSPTPTSNQITVWNNLMVPCSRILDPLFFNLIGKSILGIWCNRGDIVGK